MSSERTKKAHKVDVRKNTNRHKALGMMDIIENPDTLFYTDDIIKIFSEFLFRYPDADYHYNIDFLPEMYSTFYKIAKSCKNMVDDLRRILEFANELAVVKSFNANLSTEEEFYFSVNDLIRINMENELDWCEEYSEFSWKKMNKPYVFKIYYSSEEYIYFEIYNDWYDTVQSLESFVKNVEKARKKP